MEARSHREEAVPGDSWRKRADEQAQLEYRFRLWHSLLDSTPFTVAALVTETDRAKLMLRSVISSTDATPFYPKHIKQNLTL